MAALDFCYFVEGVKIMPYSYDVALSFAGEDRAYVDEVANILKQEGIHVFYDDFEKENLWGENLYTHLREVYSEKAQYTIMFCSKYYARKLWTNHERESAQERAFRENKTYILPVRFDDTKIPGILDTIGYIDLRNTSADKLCKLIIRKLGRNSIARSEVDTVKKLFERSRFSDAVLLFKERQKFASLDDTLYYILSTLSEEEVSSLSNSKAEELYSLIESIKENERPLVFDYLWLIIFYESTNKSMVSRSLKQYEGYIKSRVLSKDLNPSYKKYLKSISLVTTEAKLLTA